MPNKGVRVGLASLLVISLSLVLGLSSPGGLIATGLKGPSGLDRCTE